MGRIFIGSRILGQAFPGGLTIKKSCVVWPERLDSAGRVQNKSLIAYLVGHDRLVTGAAAMFGHI